MQHPVLYQKKIIPYECLKLTKDTLFIRTTPLPGGDSIRLYPNRAKVFKGGEFVNDNTLTVYIKRLREKLEEDKADPAYILTVRGMGYRINDEFMEK